MSRTVSALLVGPNSTQQAKPFRMFLSDVRRVRVDLSALCGDRGTTLTSATWTSDNGISIGTTSTSGFVATAFITANNVGTYRGKVVAAFGDGTAKVLLWRVVVVDSEAVTFEAPPVDYLELMDGENLLTMDGESIELL